MSHPRLADIKRRLDVILDDAAKVFYRAVAAIDKKTWSAHHAEALTKRVNAISELLAYCEDGKWFAIVRADEEMQCLIEGMRNYTEECEELLMKTATARNEVRDERIKTASDRWLMSRTLKIAGVSYKSDDLVCTNPAFGRGQLDEWETKLRAGLIDAKAKRAA